MTEELRQRMESLRMIAPRLNNASNTVASVIATAEEFLSNLNVGIEGRGRPYASKRLGVNDDGQRFDVESRLAYGRINGKFAIHVVHETWTIPGGNYDDPEPEIVDEEQVAWSSVSRQQKLKAFASIEGLFEDIETRAVTLAEEAEKIGDRLGKTLAALGSTLARPEPNHDARDEGNTG